VKQVALPREFDGSSPLEMRGDAFRHLARVRRVRPGSRLRGCTPDGRAFELVVEEVGRESLRLSALAPAQPAAGAGWEITLLQCVPRGPRLDLIVRQAVETGVRRIVLVESQRSLSRGPDWSGRLERLRRIAREAMEQSGGRLLADIEGPVALSSLRAAEGGVALFLHERPLATLEGSGGFVYSPPAADLAAAPREPAGAPGLHDYLAGTEARVDLLVGPEGGLAAGEAMRLVAAGFRPVYLGDTVLRVETAVLFGLGAVKTLLLERERWTTRQKQR
jgi:16S rRNA (uracil1498-N3)-methyltransferase